MVTEFTDFNIKESNNNMGDNSLLVMGDNSLLAMGDNNSMKCLKCNLLMKKI